MKRRVLLHCALLLLCGQYLLMVAGCESTHPTPHNPPPDPEPEVFGSVYVAPAGLTSSIDDGIALRYRFMVKESVLDEIWNIVFFGYALHNPDNAGSRFGGNQLETVFFNSLFQYTNHEECLAFQQDLTISQGASIHAAVPTYQPSQRIGGRTTDAINFPKRMEEIDAFAGFWKAGFATQTDITGKEGLVEITREGLIEEPTNWSCLGPLDAEPYRQWRMKFTIEGQIYEALLAVKEQYGRYLTTPIIATEYFRKSSLFTLWIWDFEMFSDSQQQWRAIQNWRVFYDDAPNNPDVGYRRIWNDETAMMEISNNKAHTYTDIDIDTTLDPQSVVGTCTYIFSSYDANDVMLELFPLTHDDVTDTDIAELGVEGAQELCLGSKTSQTLRYLGFPAYACFLPDATHWIVETMFDVTVNNQSSHASTMTQAACSEN